MIREIFMFINTLVWDITMHPDTRTSVFPPCSWAVLLVFWADICTVQQFSQELFLLCPTAWAQITNQGWLPHRRSPKAHMVVKKCHCKERLGRTSLHGAVSPRRRKSPYLQQPLLNLCPAGAPLVRCDEVCKCSEKNRAVTPQGELHLFSSDWPGRSGRFLINNVAFELNPSWWLDSHYCSLWWQDCSLRHYLARLVHFLMFSFWFNFSSFPDALIFALCSPPIGICCPTYNDVLET